MLSLVDEVPLSINVLIKRVGSNYTQINPVIDIIKYSDNILLRFIRTDTSDCQVNFWKINNGTVLNPYSIVKSTKTIQNRESMDVFHKKKDIFYVIDHDF